MKFGVNTFVWASPFNTAEHLDLIDKVDAMGFDVIEIAIEDPALVNVHDLDGRLREVGLAALVCGAFGPGRNLASESEVEQRQAAAYIRELVDMAAALGSPVVSGPMYGAVGKTPAPDLDARQRERDRAAAELRELARYAAGEGVKLAFEPLNRFETDLINVVDQGLALIAAVDHPALGMHLDTFHMHLEERDMAAAIQRAGDRLFHFHACENDRGVPGTGQVNWPAVAGALQATGYDGAVVIESFTPAVKTIARAVCIWRDIAPSQDAIAADGLAFLRKLLAA